MTYRSRKIDQFPLGKFLKENFGEGQRPFVVKQAYQFALWSAEQTCKHPHNVAVVVPYSGNKQPQKPLCLAENTKGNTR